MSYPLSTSIHLFGMGAPLNDQIRRHVLAGFRFLDFNFRSAPMLFEKRRGGEPYFRRNERMKQEKGQ